MIVVSRGNLWSSGTPCEGIVSGPSRHLHGHRIVARRRDAFAPQSSRAMVAAQLLLAVADAKVVPLACWALAGGPWAKVQNDGNFNFVFWMGSGQAKTGHYVVARRCSTKVFGSGRLCALSSAAPPQSSGLWSRLSSDRLAPHNTHTLGLYCIAEPLVPLSKVAVSPRPCFPRG
jgi:hypothetical protein